MNLFDLYARIFIDTSEYEKGLSDAGEKTSSFSDKLKTGLATAAKVGAAAITAASAAVAALTKSSLEQYGEYEQLVGGVETLFKKASDTVLNYAQNAYKTAGLSANQYMSTVTSFSASLLQSLGNDTSAAAAMADLAITDMADNANKMGTSIEMIQNAYQGFAKQNFTMLDNLKLGYGGTKTEMERLLADAEELKAANGEMVSYSIDSFADMVEAIHVVQTEMGITGTTAAEASSTIEGSISSMKSAWNNLSTGMADETADMETLVKNFVDSVDTAGKNIVPRVEQIVRGIGTASVEAVSYLRETNRTIDTLITAIDDVAVAAGAASTVIAGSLAGTAVKNVATVFMANAEELAYFTVESGAAAVAEATLSGTFSVSEIVVGVLTGKIKLATAAQYAWNTAISANPIGLLAASAAGLGIIVKKLIDSQEESAKALAGQAESAEEAAAKIDDLKGRMKELEEEYPVAAERTDVWYSQMNTLTMALREAEDQYAEFAEQQRIAQEEAAAAAEAAADPVNIFHAATELYQQDATALYEKFVETYEGIYDKVAGWFGPFEKAATTVKTNINDMMAAMQSQIDFNNAYNANLQALKEYGLGGLSEAFQSYGKDGAAYAQAIVEAVEQAGGATSEQGQQIIQGFSQINDGVTQSREELANTMALFNGELEGELEEMNTAWAEAIQDMDKSKEANIAMYNTFQALVSSMNNNAPAVESKSKEIGQRITKAIQSGIGKITATVDVVMSGSIPGYANGLDFVPYDNYLAYLHKGEAVLTASEAAAYRAGKGDSSTGSSGSGGSTIINQYIDTVPQTAVEFAAATAAYFEQARWL